MKRKLRKIPEFKSEKEERKFWQENDSADYIDWNRSEKVVFSSLKPSTTSISIRLPNTMLTELRVLANKLDVPYQSLIKMIIQERITKENRGITK